MLAQSRGERAELAPKPPCSSFRGEVRPMPDAQYWRDRAEEVRARAEAMHESRGAANLAQDRRGVQKAGRASGAPGEIAAGSTADVIVTLF
jgi:hypothetical protein